MRAVQAFSKQSDAAVAVAEAVDSCKRALGGGKPIAALCFFGADFDANVVARTLAECLGPNIPTIGCTTDGEITNAGLTVDSVCVMILSSEHVTAKAAVVEQLSTGALEAGRKIAQTLASPTARVLVLCLDGPHRQRFRGHSRCARRARFQLRHRGRHGGRSGPVRQEHSRSATECPTAIPSSA